MQWKLFRIGYCLLVLLSSQSHATQADQWLKALDLAQYKNSVVYLDFWASWCEPCRESFPWLNQMQEKYKSRGLVIIGVSLDRDKIMAERFLAKIPAQFLLYSDPSGEQGKRYKLQGMPSAYIFDGNGELSEQHVGFTKNKTNIYENNIVKLLDKLPVNKE